VKEAIKIKGEVISTRKNSIKKAGKVVAFLAIIFSITMFLQKVLTPKWESDGLWEPVTSMVDGFYDEPRQTLDVIYLGSSNAFYDINPLVIYDACGITGYVLGSGEQRIACSYYYLQEVLKRQSPRVVVLDCLSVYASDSPQEEQNRKAYDYMPLSVEKVTSLKANIGEEESLVSYLFPLMRYHGRVWELGRRDFTYLISDKHYPLKGYAYSDKRVENLPRLNMDVVLHKGIEINQENELYLSKIKELCEERGIQLFLIKTPNIEWGIYEHEGVEALAKRLNVPFVDYNTFYSQLGISEEDCFLDGAHLNYKGAEKLSLDLGERVLSLMDEIPEHGEDTRRAWDEDYAYYKRM